METEETRQVVDLLNQQQQQQEKQQQTQPMTTEDSGVSKSITIQPDGSVVVAVPSSTDEDPNAVQQTAYPDVEAARASGHEIETFDDEETGKEEIIEEEVLVVEEEQVVENGEEYVVEDGEGQVVEEVVEEVEEVVEVLEEQLDVPADGAVEGSPSANVTGTAPQGDAEMSSANKSSLI